MPLKDSGRITVAPQRSSAVLGSSKRPLLECISGSRAFNLATEHSDTDIKGVYYLPQELYYSLDYIPQVNNETNDIVYYELGRFVELLCASNPNMLELINSPEQVILYKHPLITKLKPEWFLTKTCIQTFTQYAQGQIKKAQGLNKKIVNPVDKEFKSVLSFCYMIENGKSIALNQWLTQKNWLQQHIGLVNIAHAQDLYAVYYDEQGHYQGVIKKENATDVAPSSVPKSAILQGYLSFNKEGYSAYCKSYHEYWQWVNKRNEARYQQNVEHSLRYDSKNMMHTFRLLYMALDVAKTTQLKVWHENREELLAIKQGLFSYDELLQRSEQLIEQIHNTAERCELPDHVNKQTATKALIQIRQQLYAS